MTLLSFHQTREDLKRTHDADERIRVLVAGARASVNQNAIFPSDLKWAIEWLNEAKALMESLTISKVSQRTR